MGAVMRCMKKRTLLALWVLCLPASQAGAQSVLFDFDSTPYHTPLPIDLTVGDITASFSGTGQSYSIQLANISGIGTPAGFSGNCIYPNSAFPSDLLVSFSQALRDASIMFAPSELGCDSSATMRITGYMNGAFVATSTATAPVPGTWPTGVLTLSAPQGFDSVVIHYDAFPPNCETAGPIFVADNMTVTPLPTLSIDDVAVAEGNSGTTTLGFTVSLSAASDQTVTVDFATADGTATTADADYVTAWGTLSFSPGVTTQPLSVTVNGDVKNEANETLEVNLSAATNAPIWDSQGIGTINNDDAAPTGTAFYTVSPCRVLDSRLTAGPWGGVPLGAQKERTVTVVGGACGVPVTAVALSFNITATGATAGGNISVYPAGGLRPGTPVVYFVASQTRANNGIASLGAAGDLAFFSGQASGSVHIILDVSGYFE